MSVYLKPLALNKASIDMICFVQHNKTCVPTCHSDGEVPHGLFVSSENTNINAWVLVRYVCDFHDGSADLDTGRGLNPASPLVPVDRHAGPGAEVAAQLQDVARL